MKNIFSLITLLIVFGSFQNSFSQNTINSKKVSGIELKGSFITSLDFGISYGVSDETVKINFKAPNSFMFITNYHLSNLFSLGLGFGFDFYEDYKLNYFFVISEHSFEETFIPIVVDLHYSFSKGKFSPFIFFQSGYSISRGGSFFIIPTILPGYQFPTIKSKGGFLINAGFGLRKMLSSNFGITLSGRKLSLFKSKI